MSPGVEERLKILREYRAKVDAWWEVVMAVRNAKDSIERTTSAVIGPALRQEICEMKLLAERYIQDVGVETPRVFDWREQSVDLIDAAIGEYKRRASAPIVEDAFSAGEAAEADADALLRAIRGVSKGGAPAVRALDAFARANLSESSGEDAARALINAGLVWCPGVGQLMLADGTSAPELSEDARLTIVAAWNASGAIDATRGHRSVPTDVLHEALPALNLPRLTQAIEELTERRLLRSELWNGTVSNPFDFGEVALTASGRIHGPRLAKPNAVVALTPVIHPTPQPVQRNQVGGQKREATPKAMSPSKEAAEETRSLLFLDVHGWSQLQEDQICEYVTRALPEIAQILTDATCKNTWGDGIVATFTSAKAAALAALQIRLLFDQAGEGIAAGMTCRISLHEGRVILLHNAIRDAEDIFGDDVHLAARLEPVTSEGHVFATESFAQALGKTSDKRSPIARRLGKYPLHKKYGDIEMFVITYPNAPDPSSALRVELDVKRAAAQAAHGTEPVPMLRLDLADPAVGVWLESKKEQYRHVRVSSPSKTPCADVRVMLTSIQTEDADGTLSLVWRDRAELQWRNDPQDKIGPTRAIGANKIDCDLVRVSVSNDDAESKLEAMTRTRTGSLPRSFERDRRYVLTMKAEGREGESAELAVRMVWDGQWHADTEEFAKHLCLTVAE